MWFGVVPQQPPTIAAPVVTYDGRPVYHYSGDSVPGDTTGNYPGWSPVKV